MRYPWFPWLLLAVSLTGNLLWLSQDAPTAAAPTKATISPVKTVLPPSESTPRSLDNSTVTSVPVIRATESATLASYIDLLARDVTTAEQKSGINQVLARWLSVDPAAASEWLNNHPHKVFDPAVRTAAVNLVAANRIQEAAEWASSIQDPSERMQAFIAIYAESYRHHKISAQQLRATGLPKDVIDGILNYSTLD